MVRNFDHIARRSAAGVFIFLAVTIASATGALAQDANAAVSTTVTRAACATSATDAQSRKASFKVSLNGRSEAVSGLRMRPVLEEKAPGAAKWTRLLGSKSPAGLGAWQSGSSRANVIKRTITVRALKPGNTYRLAVAFRWSQGGKTYSRSRASKPCLITDSRPNLKPVGSELSDWSVDQFTSVVSSTFQVETQARAADALELATSYPVVEVQLVQEGTILATGSFAVVPGAQTVKLLGRPCKPGSDLEVVIDPSNLVDEANEDDNRLRTTCPAIAKPSAS